MATLYIVATPIGNLKDISERALSVLSNVSVIAAEDTRHTGILLSHYNIRKRLIACHQHNEKASSKGIIALLDEGLDVAYCSDAGTPGVSDPGSYLVEEVRKNGHQVVPVPGPSAFVTLLSVSGIVPKSYIFEGFLPQKDGKRRKRLNELFAFSLPFFIYESPYRAVKCMRDIVSIDRFSTVVMGRELTKEFEEIRKEGAEEILALLEARKEVKGEFVFLIIPSGGQNDNTEEDQDS